MYCIWYIIFGYDQEQHISNKLTPRIVKKSKIFTMLILTQQTFDTYVQVSGPPRGGGAGGAVAPGPVVLGGPVKFLNKVIMYNVTYEMLPSD